MIQIRPGNRGCRASACAIGMAKHYGQQRRKHRLQKGEAQHPQDIGLEQGCRDRRLAAGNQQRMVASATKATMTARLRAPPVNARCLSDAVSSIS
jgi:hypothetical protein